MKELPFMLKPPKLISPLLGNHDHPLKLALQSMSPHRPPFRVHDNPLELIDRNAEPVEPLRSASGSDTRRCPLWSRPPPCRYERDAVLRDVLLGQRPSLAGLGLVERRVQEIHGSHR